MYLGIEIGGTKLQVGVSDGLRPELEHLDRFKIDRSAGSDGILSRLVNACPPLINQYNVRAIGIGFGGPVDSRNGIITKSYHVDGWDGFAISDWCENNFGVESYVDNDCNVSCLAEASFGAGADNHSVMYVTVGTGVGAGLVIDGEIFGSGRPTIMEIGHLRPFPLVDESIVEDYSAGPGIARRYNAAMFGRGRDPLTTVEIADAALEGEPTAMKAFEEGVRVLCWAIAQAITITAPEIVVVGGGVSLVHDSLFLNPLRLWTSRYVMDALAGSYEIRKAGLGEEVVVHGAISLARLRQGHRD